MTKEELQTLRSASNHTWYDLATAKTVSIAILTHLIELSEQPAEPKKRWRAGDGGEYWLVDNDGSYYEVTDYKYYGDDTRYAIGNYFRTEAEASAAAEKVRELFLSLKVYAQHPKAQRVTGDGDARRVANEKM